MISFPVLDAFFWPLFKSCHHRFPPASTISDCLLDTTSKLILKVFRRAAIEAGKSSFVGQMVGLDITTSLRWVKRHEICEN